MLTHKVLKFETCSVVLFLATENVYIYSYC